MQPPPPLLVNYHHGWRLLLSNKWYHTSSTPRLRPLRRPLIKNHLSEPAFPWRPTGINRGDVNSGLFLYSSVIIWKWALTQPAAENEYWSERPPKHEAEHETQKVERRFSLACRGVSFDFPSAGVTAAGFLPPLMETWVVMLSDRNTRLPRCLDVCWAYEQRVRMDQWLLKGLMGSDRREGTPSPFVSSGKSAFRCCLPVR